MPAQPRTDAAKSRRATCPPAAPNCSDSRDVDDHQLAGNLVVRWQSPPMTARTRSCKVEMPPDPARTHSTPSRKKVATSLPIRTSVSRGLVAFPRRYKSVVVRAIVVVSLGGFLQVLCSSIVWCHVYICLAGPIISRAGRMVANRRSGGSGNLHSPLRRPGPPRCAPRFPSIRLIARNVSPR